MAFYIQPPAGDISISQLENWAVKRLQLLLDIFGCHGNMDAVKQLMESPSSVEQSDCLIEGTTKDAVSHFILRLTCAGDAMTAKVFVESETVLFLYRLTSLSEAELLRYLGSLRCFQKQLTKHLESLDLENGSPKFPLVIMDIFRFFKMLTETFDWRTLIHHYCLKSDEHFVCLPFKFALDMVSKRQVILSNGKAIVPCTHLPQLLRWFFHSWLTYGIHLAKNQHARFVEDSRMKRISAMCKNLIQRHCHNSSATNSITVFKNLVALDIDRIVNDFPPCMLHLHESLRRNHRLKHYSRIAYLLFMKDLGLPVNEAVSFWRQEYCRPFPVSSSYHGCRHSWQKEEKRLTYGIHHLYGLKGARQKYSSHTCAYIQNHDWGPAEEAVCPFYHFNSLKLQKCLSSYSLSTPVWSRICEFVERKQPCMACSVFLEAKIQQQMSEAKEPCNEGFSAKESCSGQDSKIADKTLGNDKNMVLQMGIDSITCNCSCDSILSVSPKSDFSADHQFLERADDEVMMKSDLPTLFKKPKTGRSLMRSLNFDSHEMPKFSAGLEEKLKCLKGNSYQDSFSSDIRSALAEQPPGDSGYCSSQCLSSNEHQAYMLSNSDEGRLCQEELLINKGVVLNLVTSQQRTQFAEKYANTKDFLVKIAVDADKSPDQNVLNTESRSSFRASSKIIDQTENCCRRRAPQNFKECVNSASKNRSNAAVFNNSWKHPSSLKKTRMFELNKKIYKPIDFFQSYNELVAQFCKKPTVS